MLWGGDREDPSTTIVRTYSVSGLACDGCRVLVEEALLSVGGVSAASVDVDAGKGEQVLATLGMPLQCADVQKGLLVAVGVLHVQDVDTHRQPLFQHIQVSAF